MGHQLCKKLKKAFPFEVSFSNDAASHLRDRGIRKDKTYTVVDIIDSGFFGGILCAIPMDDEAIVVSLTHLCIDDNHPLAGKVTEYQKERARVIHEQNLEG